MIEFTEEQLASLLEAGNEWEKISLVLSELDIKDLIEILDKLNNIINLIEINQYARMKKEDD